MRIGRHSSSQFKSDQKFDWRSMKNSKQKNFYSVKRLKKDDALYQNT